MNRDLSLAATMIEKGRSYDEVQRMLEKVKGDSILFWFGLLRLETMPDTMGELKQAYHNACFAHPPDRFQTKERRNGQRNNSRRFRMLLTTYLDSILRICQGIRILPEVGIVAPIAFF